ncbi:MAG: NAD-binding protein [Pseudomonadales bacterium]|jgi:Trk K+ transport system NAD-binding subunit|nr:NAD-binding protein [Pseudomonadales bacterium]
MSRLARRPQPGIFLLLRRLRLPLIALISVYAVAIFGFTLLPGVDPEGNDWKMSFFHAFYFVSFVGPTIGLGEIPYPFSDAQRLWAAISMYCTVVAWLYAIGALLSTIQDPLFRRIMHENRVGRAVRRLREPFVLICGYGDAGTLIARELTEEGIAVVVIDRKFERVESVEIDELSMEVPALHADAVHPGSLLLAGIDHPQCLCTLALTEDDAVNLTVALNAKLLAPEHEVICEVHHHEHHAAMARIGVEHIINPYDTFAERLALTMRIPSLHVIYEALTTQAGNAMAPALIIPKGRWVVCGYGRFGRSICRHLSNIGVEVMVIDDNPAPDAGAHVIRGNAMDAEVMRKAGIEQADGVVVASANDTLCLAIASLAHELNPGIFTVVRQNERRNTPMFRAFDADISTLAGYVVAAEVLRIIRAPQLSYFLRLARLEDEQWAHALLERMRTCNGKETVEAWSLSIDARNSPALVGALRSGRRVTVGDLLRAPDNRDLPVKAVPLLLQHAEGKQLLPDPSQELREGEQLLFCGRMVARGRLYRTVHDDQVLAYVLDGIETRRRVPWLALPRSG